MVRKGDDHDQIPREMRERVRGPDKTQPVATEWEGIPLEAKKCNGVFISYDLLGWQKEFPNLKNITAQSWAFDATAKVLNTGNQVVNCWKLYVGFQHDVLLCLSLCFLSPLGRSPTSHKSTAARRALVSSVASSPSSSR
ncbi:hypothetical protein PIB30_041967 [Stylosanthes scabra]|uniref:Uncharacterized protein n=1 Tax=Stylosanthes scabra TaxID=79078 RepID=A0ABU6VFU8_9FABA|nr:hypothetical protein [Stylosanthes scabra]